MDSMHGNQEERLDALFRAYRAACPEPEASANFMPELWRKIEARQKVTFSFGRMANAFVTAALALTIALGVYMSVPNANPYSPQSYVEALAEANPLDTPDIVAPVHIDRTDPGR
ncbi:MAG TPA: hypothetical protein VMH81_30190 [Bryobacteraceae bacterium]|nr:hypothetical protein [Bryobacteraceae bacterium]